MSHAGAQCPTPSVILAVSVAYSATQCGISSINMIPRRMQRSTHHPLDSGSLSDATQTWVAHPGNVLSMNNATQRLLQFILAVSVRLALCGTPCSLHYPGSIVRVNLTVDNVSSQRNGGLRESIAPDQRFGTWPQPYKALIVHLGKLSRWNS